MELLSVALIWCVLHFLLFVAARGFAKVRRERFAFLFHVVSFALLAAVAAYAVITGSQPIVVGLGALAIHGIYSLTVLEVWSLSEGSYALSMLRRLADKPSDKAGIVAQFAALGESKRSSRLTALRDGGLIEGAGTVALTKKGRVVALAIAALRRLANFENAG